MIQVIFSETLGFCMGVRKAVEKAYKEAENREASPVYTFGPLIHNETITEELKQLGVSILKDPQKGVAGTVIIRAHGVHPEVKKQLQAYHERVVDATCPNVLNNQRKVKEYSDKGYQIIIVGDKNHGEILGLAGYAENPVLLANRKEAIDFIPADKAVIISQTTIKQDEYDAVCHILRKKNENIIIINSICSATAGRQNALKELCTKVEAVLVIGGKNSANTQRLFNTAKESGLPCWHIVNEKEIPKSIYKYKIIGITAGASTPDSIIEKIKNLISG